MLLHVVDSCVRGFHVYKDIWTPIIGEVFSCEREDGNPMDPYAVAIKRGSEVIGHVPQKISAACSLFMQRGGAATCRIVDSHHQYSSDLPQGGLQIPCQLVFQSEDTELIEKIKKIVKSAPPIDLKPAKTMPKRKLESRLKLSHEAMVEPVKKKDRVSDNPAIDLSTGPSARDTVKEIPWVKFGRQILTTADKDIILGGMALGI